MRVLLVMGCLLAVNLYVLYYRHGTSVPALLRAADAGRQASLLPGPTGAPPVPRSLKKALQGAGALRGFYRVVEVPFESEDATIETALSAEGIKGKPGEVIAEALHGAVSGGGETGIRPGPGQSLALYYDAEDQFQAVDYRVAPDLGYRAERMAAVGASVPGNTAMERYVVSKQDRPMTMQTVTVAGVVQKDGALPEAMLKLGESETLSVMVTETFAHDADLPLTSQAGDRFRVVVEKVFLGKGFYRYGRVLAASYEGKAAALRAYLFAPEAGKAAAGGKVAAGYYNERGENLARTTLRSPLRMLRAGNLSPLERRHAMPVLHAERRNLGTDYGAPLGTAVRAVAAGQVASHGARGLLGSTIVLTHGGQMETLYQHLSHFARGLKDGQTVRKGQVIGYVGASGAAGKPHLHLGLRLAGKLLDPQRLRQVREAAVAAAEKAVFAQRVRQLDLQLDPQGAAVAQSR